jgi:hypothetical protein
VAGGERRDGVVVQLLRPGSIAGRVTASGKPVADAIVSLQESAGAALKITATDPEGMFEFEGIPAGVYEVAISDERGEGKATVAVRPGETSEIAVDIRR